MYVHQMWLNLYPEKRNIFEDGFNLLRESWSNSQGLEYIFWTDERIESEFPQWTNLVNTFPFAICKADFYRFLILYEYGGIYADLDILNIRTVDEWANYFNSIENNIILTPEMTGANTLYNGIMISKTKKNPFWLYCAMNSLNYKKSVYQFNSQVKELRPYEITGPIMVYHCATEWNSMYPLNKVHIEHSWKLHPILFVHNNGTATVYNHEMIIPTSSRACYFSIQKTEGKEKIEYIKQLVPNSMTVPIHFEFGSTWKPYEKME